MLTPRRTSSQGRRRPRGLRHRQCRWYSTGSIGPKALSASASARCQASRNDSSASRSLQYTSRRPTRTAICPWPGAGQGSGGLDPDVLHPLDDRLGGDPELVVVAGRAAVLDGPQAPPGGRHEPISGS